MATSEELVVLPMDGGGQGQIQSFTLSEADLAGNYGQLKPIIMTMANMANVSEEVQVSIWIQLFPHFQYRKYMPSWYSS